MGSQSAMHEGLWHIPVSSSAREPHLSQSQYIPVSIVKATSISRLAGPSTTLHDSLGYALMYAFITSMALSKVRKSSMGRLSSHEDLTPSMASSILPVRYQLASPTWMAEPWPRAPLR